MTQCDGPCFGCPRSKARRMWQADISIHAWDQPVEHLQVMNESSGLS